MVGHEAVEVVFGVSETQLTLCEQFSKKHLSLICASAGHQKPRFTQDHYQEGLQKVWDKANEKAPCVVGVDTWKMCVNGGPACVWPAQVGCSNDTNNEMMFRGGLVSLEDLMEKRQQYSCWLVVCGFPHLDVWALARPAAAHLNILVECVSSPSMVENALLTLHASTYLSGPLSKYRSSFWAAQNLPAP